MTQHFTLRSAILLIEIRHRTERLNLDRRFYAFQSSTHQSKSFQTTIVIGEENSPTTDRVIVYGLSAMVSYFFGRFFLRDWLCALRLACALDLGRLL